MRNRLNKLNRSDKKNEKLERRKLERENKPVETKEEVILQDDVGELVSSNKLSGRDLVDAVNYIKFLEKNGGKVPSRRSYLRRTGKTLKDVYGLN